MTNEENIRQENASSKSWKFPGTFWTANVVELFERTAYYAVFIAITLYLSRVVGYDDINAAWISGIFSAGLYFLPPFTGALADKIGFRNAILTAFILLTIGYTSLGLFPYKTIVLPSLIILMFGGSFIKSIITGTVAKTTTEATRAKGYSIFYGMVNVGSFTGKTFAYPIRIELGVEMINFYAAFMTFIALIVVYFYYRNISDSIEKRNFRQVWQSFIRVVTNMRLLVLIIIVSGFWIIQHQLYATMPKYVLRLVGEGAAPEWIANVNPLVVVLMVVFITNLMRNVKAVTSMSVGMFLMPVSALLMASSSLLESFTGSSVDFFGWFSAHPVTVMMIAGIMVQGLAECFISPRYLEYFSLQAPKGEEGLYLGFSHLHSFISSLLGFGISGYLLSAYAPDPASLNSDQLVHAYDKAYYIWYYFAAIGFGAALALLVYRRLFDKVS